MGLFKYLVKGIGIPKQNPSDCVANTPLGGLGKAALADDFDESAKVRKSMRIPYKNIIQSINSFLSYIAAT
jgi:hypothetical protein